MGAIRVQMEAEGLAAEPYEISADKLQKYLLVIVHRGDEGEENTGAAAALRLQRGDFPGNDRDGGGEYPFSGTGAGKNKKTHRGMTPLPPSRPVGKPGRPSESTPTGSGPRRQGAVRRASCRTDETVLYFQGWVPAEQGKGGRRVPDGKGLRLGSAGPHGGGDPRRAGAAEKQLAHETAEHGHGDVLPACMTMWTPTPDGTLFILFYGIMMADMGYGLLMFLAGFLISKKTRPRARRGTCSD